MREHKFKHSFQYTLKPHCDCGMEIASFTHFLSLCTLFINKICTLMRNLNKIDSQISKFNFSNLRNTVPFGKSPFNDKINKLKYVVTNLYQIFCDLPIFKCSTLNNVPLLHPLKTSSFLKFSGVIEVEHWLKWVKYMIYILLVID